LNLEDVTVVTTAFGNPEGVMQWASRWLELKVRCIVCDNGGVLPEALPDSVVVLPFTGNTGFGGGINRAVSCADTPLVLVTNPDTLPCSPNSLLSLMESHLPGSISSGVLLDSEGREVPSGGIWPNIIWLKRQIFGRTKSLWRDDRIDWIQGALFLCHKQDFLELQGFSPRFPLYFEDVDLCARAKKQGMEISFCRKCRFIHDEGSGADKATATRLSCFHWGMLEYFRIHDPENAEAVRKMIMAKCMLRMFAYGLVNPEAARGYFRALQSVSSGIAPLLPGESNG